MKLLMISAHKNSTGFIHIVPLLVVALVLAGTLVAFSAKDLSLEGRQGSVLKSEDDDSSGSGSSGSGSSDNRSGSSGSGSSGNSDSSSSEEEAEFRVETRSPSGIRVRTRTEQGKARVDIYENGRKLRIETEDGETTVKIENEDEEVEDEIELEEDEEFEVPATGGGRLRIRTSQGRFVLRDGEVEAHTNFPLSIDLATNELIVTTPRGAKRVAILPQQAVDNMLRVGHVDVILPAPSPSPTPEVSPTPEGSPEASPSASPEASLEPTATPSAELAISGVEIVEEDGEVVYRIRGAARERFLGLIEVLIPKTLLVSAETGELVNTEQSLIDRILGLLSF